MDRAVLLALLAIPVLVIIHVALFWQPIPLGGEVFSTAYRDTGRVQLRGHWQVPDQTSPSRFIIAHPIAQGS